MRFLKLLIFAILLSACSSEKITLSPVQESLVSGSSIAVEKKFPQNFNQTTGRVFYASQLSSHIATFPKFKNSALNQEVATLKFHVKEYVYATESFNIVGQKSALGNLEKSYKKIQNLRKYLTVEDDEVINRYLVRIKSNVAQLQSLSEVPQK